MEIFESGDSTSESSHVVEIRKGFVQGRAGDRDSNAGSSAQSSQRPSDSNEGTVPECEFSSALSGGGDNSASDRSTPSSRPSGTSIGASGRSSAPARAPREIVFAGNDGDMVEQQLMGELEEKSEARMTAARQATQVQPEQPKVHGEGGMSASINASDQAVPHTQIGLSTSQSTTANAQVRHRRPESVNW
jgi:hypothetical protein